MKRHLNYDDIIYHQLNNESFTQKNEIIQPNAVLAIASAMRGISQSKLYGKLGFVSLKFRKTSGLPDFLLYLILQQKSFLQYSFVGRCYNILQLN